MERLATLETYRHSLEEQAPLVCNVELRGNLHKIALSIGHHGFVVTIPGQPRVTNYADPSHLHFLYQTINCFAGAEGNRDVRHSWRFAWTHHQFQTSAGA